MYILSGKSGKVLWKKRVAEELALHDGGYTNTIQTGIDSLMTLDSLAGQLVRRSRDK